MTLHRFFIPAAWLTPPVVSLYDETARQIRTVLRMKPDDEIIVLDNSGVEWQVRLTGVDKQGVTGQIIDRRPAPGEPAVELTLYQATLKGQKFEWVLQKGTELGVGRFAPVICRRSVVDNGVALTKKYSRWRRIIQEAAEQSGRGKLPELAPPLSFAEALRQANLQYGLGLMPWTGAETSLKAVLAGKKAGRIAVFIGPEGGFTGTEAGRAQESGVQPVTLGPRILRAETAGLAVCAAIFYELGE